MSPLTGYSGTFYVKKYKTDEEYAMEVTGSTSGNTVTFHLTPTDTAIASGKYQYEIVISNGTNKYTTNQGDFVVLDSIATHDPD